MRDFTAKEAVENATAGEFVKNNGLVFRAVGFAKSISWFDVSELKDILKNRIANDDLQESLIYLTDEGYLKVRVADTKQECDVCDFDIEDLEFRLSSKGKKFSNFVIKDDLISL